MSSAFSFMIHNDDLEGLSNIYVTIKRNVIEQDRISSIGYKNKDDYSYLKNPTLTAVRDLIKLKLTGELREMYLDVYDGENSNSYALDVTTFNEWYYIKRKSVELDLEHFFDCYDYEFFYSREKLLDVEIEAEIDEAKSKYSDYLEGEYFKAMLDELESKRKQLKK